MDCLKVKELAFASRKNRNQVVRSSILALLIGLVNCFPSYAKDQADELLAKLPGSIEGLIGAEVHSFKDPRLGASRKYTSNSGAKIAIFLFDLGVKEIPDGSDSKVVKLAFDLAQGEIDLFIRRGDSRNIRILDMTPRTFSFTPSSAMQFLTMSYTSDEVDPYSAESKQVESHLLVSGLHGYVLKIRITQPMDTRGRLQVKYLVDSFLESLRS